FSTTNGPCPVDIQLVQDNANQYELADAMGTFQIVFASNDRVIINFTLTGKRNTVPKTGAFETGVTYDDTAPIAGVGQVATRNSVAMSCYDNFTFDLGADVQIIPCATDATGFRGA